jgi:copper resistance protein D
MRPLWGVGTPQDRAGRGCGCRWENAVDLILARAIHFAATAMVAGIVFFGAVVSGPALSQSGTKVLADLVRRRLAWLFWIALIIAAVSGVGWLVVLAQQLSGGTLTAVFLDRIVWIVLTRTDFGTVWTIRLVIAALLAAAVLAMSARRSLPHGFALVLQGAAVVLACCLAGTLAYAGHAAAGVGAEGLAHLISDVVHLVASAAWIGALLPLAILLAGVRSDAGVPSIAAARIAVQRFSTLGVISVGAIVATGIVNSYVLAGSVPALFDTDYGRLLMLKVALFLAMVSIAAVNRLRLTPQLVQHDDAPGAQRALRRLRNNSVIEACVAAVILAIVGVLGTLPPGLEEAQ